VILLVLWLVGLLSNVGGSLIHLLLVIAAVVLVSRSGWSFSLLFLDILPKIESWA
jgi:hypothetical protein